MASPALKIDMPIAFCLSVAASASSFCKRASYFSYDFGSAAIPVSKALMDFSPASFWLATCSSNFLRTSVSSPSFSASAIADSTVGAFVSNAVRPANGSIGAAAGTGAAAVTGAVEASAEPAEAAGGGRFLFESTNIERRVAVAGSYLFSAAAAGDATYCGLII